MHCFFLLVFLLAGINMAMGQIAGFSVGLTGSTTIRCDQVVIFDREFTNETNFYSNGRFTAPVEGHYMIQFSALACFRREIWLKLYHNDRYVVSLYAYESWYGAASNSMILMLERGDQLYIKAVRTSYLYGESSDIYATFSAFLLPSSYFPVTPV